MFCFLYRNADAPIWEQNKTTKLEYMHIKNWANKSSRTREFERSPKAASGKNDELRTIRALVKMSDELIFEFFRREKKTGFLCDYFHDPNSIFTVNVIGYETIFGKKKPRRFTRICGILWQIYWSDNMLWRA
jgi:hypothetical protein